jgi:hypothetical protein
VTQQSNDVPEQAARVGRRQLLVAGGATVSLGALLAACGGGGAGEPGRVGFSPVPTALPTETIDDAVYLRTAQSIENTIVDSYGRISESGALTGDNADLLATLIDEHTATAAQVAELVTEAGGEPYDCTNDWYVQRVIPPLFEQIEGNPEEDIEPSDDPERDMLTLMNAMESMAASMYQGLVEVLSTPQVRGDVVQFAVRSARHSAAVAIAATGAPNGYVSPAVRGEEVAPDESGLVPLYAIPGQFGTLNPYTLVIGAPSSAGTRATFGLETPADNSYVYTRLSCDT